MKELSLNVLDIAQNSVSAGAKHIGIFLAESSDHWLELRITDDGRGMPPEMVAAVTDPFCTTRTTRKVGMGLPLLKLAGEQTGGQLTVSSVSERADPVHHGTQVKVTFDMSHIDFTPLGDMVGTVITLIQGHPEIDYLYSHSTPCGTVSLNTEELREVLGEVSLGEFEVLEWIRDSLKEQYQAIQKK